MKFIVLICVAALAVAAVASEHDRVVMETLVKGQFEPAVPTGWTAVDANPDAMIKLTFALPQRNLDVLRERVLAVSTPSNPDYGNHLSIDDITDLIAPPQEDLEAVISFISAFPSAAGLAPTVNRDFVVVELSVADAEAMLAVDFLALTHTLTGHKTIRAREPYSLPARVAPLVSFVGGVYDLPTAYNLDKKYGTEASPITVAKNEAHARVIGLDAQEVTPSVVLSTYNITDTGSQSNNTVAVGEFQGQWYSPSDLAAFRTKYSLPAQKVAKVVGGDQPDQPGIEANLDVQYVMVTGRNIPTWFIYDSAGGSSFMDQVLNYFVTQGNGTTALVHSISYGQPEYEIPDSLEERIDTELMKLGGRGISIFFASGDSGVGCLACVDQTPDYCASSEWTTAVGALYLAKDGTSEGFEISGGGFSKRLARPSWQKDQVDAYFTTVSHLPPSFLYKKDNYGYPEMSAFGANVIICEDGAFEPVAGTSCASPMVAGIFALLNDVRIGMGKAPLGFLNPLIYEHPEAFTDVTTGKNSHLCCEGFDACEGWDPMTGMGYPSYTAWKPIVEALP